MKIAFIGNCQMIALCYYTQQLFKNSEHEIRWICYSEKFIPHIHDTSRWADKCVNKIINDKEGIDFLKKCDFIFYQKISKSTSSYFNSDIILKYNTNAKYISLPSIHLDVTNFEVSFKELKKREIDKNVTIQVTEIINKYHSSEELLLSINHPSTFFFMKIMKKICKILNVKFFNKIDLENFLKDKNYVGLP